MSNIIKIFLILTLIFSSLFAGIKDDIYTKEKMDNMSQYIIKKFNNSSYTSSDTRYFTKKEKDSMKKKMDILVNSKKKSDSFYKTSLEAYKLFITAHRAYITKWNKDHPRAKGWAFYKNNVINIKGNTEFLIKVDKNLKHLEAKISAKNSKIKLSSSKNTANSNTVLKSSNLSTTVKTNNINVTGKASVGAVSIGTKKD